MNSFAWQHLFFFDLIYLQFFFSFFEFKKKKNIMLIFYCITEQM